MRYIFYLFIALIPSISWAQQQDTLFFKDNTTGEVVSVIKKVYDGNYPMTIDGVDCIEVTAECFTNTTLPATGSTYVVIGAGGKFTAQASAPTTINQPYFTLEGLHTVTIGATEVPSAVLRFHRVPAAS